jgi:F-type H+-transporting ATPase subunit b
MRMSRIHRKGGWRLEQLGISVSYLVSQIVNFVLLMALLYVLLYKPVLGVLHERQKRIARSMADADAAREGALRAQQDYDKRILEAQRKAQEIMAQANQDGEKVRADIKSQATQEAEEIRRKARDEALEEKSRILAEVQSQIAGLSMMATERVLGQGVAVDPGLQRKLIAQFLAELGDGGKALPGPTSNVRDVA